MLISFTSYARNLDVILICVFLIVQTKQPPTAFLPQEVVFLLSYIKGQKKNCQSECSYNYQKKRAVNCKSSLYHCPSFAPGSIGAVLKLLFVLFLLLGSSSVETGHGIYRISVIGKIYGFLFFLFLIHFSYCSLTR